VLVEPRRPNRNQSAGDDLLAGYALGILTPGERAELEARLAADPALREELALLNVAVEALPLGLEPLQPSPGLRPRLHAAVEADLAATQSWVGARPAPVPLAPVPAPPTPLPVPARRPVPINVWAIAAAVLLVIASAAVVWGLFQTRQMDQPTRVIAFEMTDPSLSGSGEVAYLEQPGVMLVTMDGLPPLPEDQVYEFWLIPHAGEPIPAGVFRDTSVRHALTGSPEDYQAVALTVEPGPLGTTAPTTDPLAVAPMSPESQ
jgi:anti-sigma-K factor RskA